MTQWQIYAYDKGRFVVRKNIGAATLVSNYSLINISVRENQLQNETLNQGRLNQDKSWGHHIHL